MELLAPRLEGAIVAIGNAPTALWKIMEMARSGGPRPALVVGLPVGFVGARESKLALLGKRSVLHHQHQPSRRQPGGGGGRQRPGHVRPTGGMSHVESDGYRGGIVCGWAIVLLAHAGPGHAHLRRHPAGRLGGRSGSWWRRRSCSGDCGRCDRRRAEDPRYMTMVAMVGAAIFVISCMPVPIPWIGTCSHPCGTGLGALLIGPGPTVVVASIALLFQALFLAHGGLTTLGANIVSMGVVGAFTAYGVFHLLRAAPRARVCGGLAGRACSPIGPPTPRPRWNWPRALHGDGSMWAMFAAVMVAFVPTQLPLGIAEGFVTAVAYRFVLAPAGVARHVPRLGSGCGGTDA